MVTNERSLMKGKCCIWGIAMTIILFLFVGCAGTQQAFDPNKTGAQMIVEPSTLRLGVARIMDADTQIIFRGRGFQPEDSVFVSLLGVEKAGEKQDIPVADAEVAPDGSFTAKVGTLVKVSEFLRAKLGTGEKNQNIIIITQPPMPEGAYTAKAVSMEADKTAECQLEVKGPSLMDRLKDWIGGMMGKIKKQ
jgi:hypothetical protein